MENSQEDPENNKSLWEWSLEDVLRWLLIEFNLEEEILKNFVFHEIDGLDLIDLTEDNLKYDLKIAKINLRKRMMRRIVDLLKFSLSQDNNNNAVLTNKKHTNLNKNENRVSEAKENILFQSFSFNKNENRNNNSNKINSCLKSQIPRTIANFNTSKKTKINITLHYSMDENLKKMKFLCFATNKVESILREFKDNLNYENKKIKIIEKYDNISICDENGYLIPKETFINEIINSDLEENMFYINKSLFSHFFEIEKGQTDNNQKKKRECKPKENQIRTHREESNNNRKLKIDDIHNDSNDNRNLNSKNNNLRKRENYFHTERNEISGFESLDEFEKKMVKNKKLMNFLNKNKKGNLINFNSKSLNNNYTSAFKEKVNRFAENNNGSVMETAMKNNYLSFEKLDNLEKNITTFLDKNGNDSKERISLNNDENKNEIEKEKVTINSYYNISNLNNFNDKSLFNSLDKIQTQSNPKKDKSNKKNNNFSKSDKKRKRFVSEEGFNNDEEIDINEKSIENSELKKTALKNTKHVFNLNLNKIIDGDRLKIEKIKDNKAVKSNNINNKYYNSISESDLNYSGDSDKIEELKEKKISERIKINKKAVKEDSVDTDKMFNKLVNKKASLDLYNNKKHAISNNRPDNTNNYQKHNSLSMKYLENSNTDTDNDRKASIHIGANKNKNSILRDDKINKNIQKQDINENRINNNINKAEQKASNSKSNQFIKIEENASVKKEERINLNNNLNINKKNSDGDYCNYGEDVKNTKKSLYDEFFKNIETEGANNNYNYTNTANTNNIHNNNYSGFINPASTNSITNMLKNKYNKLSSGNNNNNDSSLIDSKNKAGNITYRETSDKYYSKIINKNSIYESYNCNIPHRSSNINLDLIQNENAGNYTSRNENPDMTYYQSLKSKNKIY